ncbi:hypothetical protein [Cellulosimicrobium cellulans]|uniref:hypothetical protein n=1 Tax=Cellulosimicrobium cellulans TaxID=1710 RepID=UPI003C35B8CD
MTSTTTRKPAGAKKPTDHQTKAKPEAKPEVTKTESGWTVVHHGITVNVETEALDDFELLDDLQAVEERNEAQRLPGILRRVVGQDGYKAVMEGLRDEKGRVPAGIASQFVFDLFGAINPN